MPSMHFIIFGILQDIPPPPKCLKLHLRESTFQNFRGSMPPTPPPPPQHVSRVRRLTYVSKILNPHLLLGNIIRKLTFREIKNVIPFAICHAKYITFFGPNIWEKSVTKPSSSTLYRLRLFFKNSRRFPCGQYSITIQRSELLPIENNC